MAIKTKQHYDDVVLLDRLDDLIGDLFHQMNMKVNALPDDTEASKDQARQYAEEFKSGAMAIIDKFVEENPGAISSLKRFYRGSRVEMYADLGKQSQLENWIKTKLGEPVDSIPDLVKKSLDHGRKERDAERAKALAEIEPQAVL